MNVTSRGTAKLAWDALDDKKGTDIKVLKIEELTVLADYFVICTGTSNTHVRTLAGAVEEALEDRAGLRPRGIEGYNAANWVLMDYGAVMVHIFLQDMREFYSIERLWGDAPEVDPSEL